MSLLILGMLMVSQLYTFGNVGVHRWAWSYQDEEVSSAAIICCSEVVSSGAGLLVLGVLNRSVFRRKIGTVFVSYPVNRFYLRSFVFEWYASRVKWRPGFAGVFAHGFSWGVTFGISAQEQDFLGRLAPRNYDTSTKMFEKLLVS